MLTSSVVGIKHFFRPSLLTQRTGFLMMYRAIRSAPEFEPCFEESTGGVKTREESECVGHHQMSLLVLAGKAGEWSRSIFNEYLRSSLFDMPSLQAQDARASGIPSESISHRIIPRCRSRPQG